MNEYFKNLIKESGKSIYSISKDTRIPYTILSELKNDKKNINHVNSETVYKLCLYFDCDMKQLLNPFPLLKNSRGRYNHVPYQWIAIGEGAGIELQIDIDKEKKTILKLKGQVPESYKHYNNIVIETDEKGEDVNIKNTLENLGRGR